MHIKEYYKVSIELVSDDKATEKAKKMWDDTTSALANAWEQIGINNPLENNLLSPIIQVLNNETWYGEINGVGFYQVDESGEVSWKKADDDILSEMESLNMTSDKRSSYYEVKEQINIDVSINESSYEAISNSNLNDEQKNYMYDKYYESNLGNYINDLEVN